MFDMNSHSPNIVQTNSHLDSSDIEVLVTEESNDLTRSNYSGIPRNFTFVIDGQVLKSTDKLNTIIESFAKEHHENLRKTIKEKI